MRRTDATRGLLALAVLVVAALTLLVGAATASAASAPSIDETSVTNISAHDATLNLQIDPHGLPTSYEVMLTTPNCPGPPGASGCQSISVWFLHGEVPAAPGDQSVSIDLANRIWPSHPYSYKVWATNPEGTAEAFGQFTTPAALPVIESESASGVTEHDATLEAQIDPNGAYTGYQFQIDTNSSYDVPRAACPFDLPGYAECDALISGEPLPSGLLEPSPVYIPASSGARSVSLDLASIGATLQPGTTYHYRVIASNGGPVVTGPDQTFTTPSESPGPIPLSAKSLGDGAQSSPAVQPPPSTSPSQHQKHKRRRLQAKLHRAKHAG